MIKLAVRRAKPNRYFFAIDIAFALYPPVESYPHYYAALSLQDSGSVFTILQCFMEEGNEPKPMQEDFLVFPSFRFMFFIVFT